MKIVTLLMMIVSLLWVGIERVIWPPVNVEVPFTAGIAGTALKIPFYVRKKQYYYLYLDLHYRESDSGDKARVEKLSGLTPLGQPIDSLAIPVHVEIVRTRRDVQIRVLDETVSNEVLESNGSGKYTRIVKGLVFEPGHYEVKIEALKNLKDLVGIPLSFAIRMRSGF